jgi:hypothetical protein
MSFSPSAWPPMICPLPQCSLLGHTVISRVMFRLSTTGEGATHTLARLAKATKSRHLGGHLDARGHLGSLQLPLAIAAPSGRQQRGLISTERRTTTCDRRRALVFSWSMAFGLRSKLGDKTKPEGRQENGAFNCFRCYSASSSCSGAVGRPESAAGGPGPVPIMGEVDLSVRAGSL